uniref:Uncharacterized protein n=1 Tax=Enterobacter sp. HP19 TaxID=1811975 RepID=A0A2H4UED7_9ENTR|nr:hypothetical protein [Enterobacter sp. HP19]
MFPDTTIIIALMILSLKPLFTKTSSTPLVAKASPSESLLFSSSSAFYFQHQQ